MEMKKILRVAAVALVAVLPARAFAQQKQALVQPPQSAAVTALPQPTLKNDSKIGIYDQCLTKLWADNFLDEIRRVGVRSTISDQQWNALAQQCKHGDPSNKADPEDFARRLTIEAVKRGIPLASLKN